MEKIVQILTSERVTADWGIRILGTYSTPDLLPDPTTYDGSYGDTFGIGDAPPYAFYFYAPPLLPGGNPYWLDLGELAIPGPQGDPGAPGDPGPAGTPAKWYVTGGLYPPVGQTGIVAGDLFLGADGRIWQYDGASWTVGVNIKGPRGPQGDIGPAGNPGRRGAPGPTGPQGKPATPVRILGSLSSVANLPDPTTAPRDSGYLITISGSIRLYYIQGDTALSWGFVPFESGAGTVVTVDGAGVSEWDSGSKIDKSTTPDTVYGVDQSGVQVNLLLSVTSEPDTIPMRNARGCLEANDPQTDNEVANKRYVDQSHVITYTASSAIGSPASLDVTTLLDFTQEGMVFFYVELGNASGLPGWTFTLDGVSMASKSLLSMPAISSPRIAPFFFAAYVHEGQICLQDANTTYVGTALSIGTSGPYVNEPNKITITYHPTR